MINASTQTIRTQKSKEYSSNAENVHNPVVMTNSEKDEKEQTEKP